MKILYIKLVTQAMILLRWQFKILLSSLLVKNNDISTQFKIVKNN